MAPSRTPADTAFAPAERAGEEVLAWQHNAFLSDSTASVLLEAMPGPTMVLNRQRQVIASNSQLRDMFSPADSERLIGMRPGEILGCVHARERETGCGTTPACARCGAVQAILESLATHARVVKECCVRTSFRTTSGALDFRAYATFAEIGGEEMVVFSLVDTSSEKRCQAFEQTIFHDLREDCADAQAFTELLERGNHTSADEAVFRQEFGELSRRVLEQIESHRQLLAAESGRLELRFADVNLRELLEQRAAACREAAVGRDREILVRADDLEPVRTDSEQLGRIVDGLLRNALEATPQGGRVQLGVARDGAAVRVSVHNAGVIPPDVQAQVFQRSFSTKHGEGRGIGTYSVKLLVERYLDGSVEFASDAEHGTVFTVTLPDPATGRQAA